MAFFETRLAARIRDYMRARDASDELAVKFGAESICHSLGCLLGAYLKKADGWDSDERWIDGMIGARVDVIDSDQLRVAGQMVWGLRADVGGDQWAEPFEADHIIGWTTSDLSRYVLRFSDRRDLKEKRVTPGLYKSVADSGGAALHGSIGRASSATPSGDRNETPRPLTSFAWAYEFRKG